MTDHSDLLKKVRGLAETITSGEHYRILCITDAANLRALADIVEAHDNVLLGIEDPKTTVPDLGAALRDLYDEQNGPPLIRRKAQWERAMKRALVVLVKAEPKSV